MIASPHISRSLARIGRDVANGLSIPLTPTWPGRGHVTVDQVAGRSTVTHLRAQSPLKLLTPNRRSPAAWIVASTLGGGLVERDDVRLTVRAGSGTTLFLGTQSSTKIYRCPDGAGCSQHLTLHVGADATCVVAPDPVTPFAGAMYEQRQEVRLSGGASVVLVDWLTSGRLARGERWAFKRYQTRTNVFVEKRLVLHDALRLDAADGPLNAPCRTGPFDCFATVILVGPAVAAAAADLLADIAKTPFRPAGPVACGASAIGGDGGGGGGGAILRLAGPGPEPVGRWIRQRLSFVAGLLGEDPWLRKW